MQLPRKDFIAATAGHVDHGKSALVKALTGTDPDRLPEEKARGITIDLGFALLETVGTDGPAFRLGLVDVPGHEDFVKNMIAGVGSVDLALFVVAADDGWMPQTEEHLQILSYLGVESAVIALTKIDLAAAREEESIRALRGALAGTAFENSEIVPTSVITGRGLAEVQRALVRALSGRPSQPDIGKPRLPIDRVFSLHGIGTIATGTLIGGALQRGQNIVVQPSGRPARIRGIQNYGRDVETSAPGTRTALNLPDLDIATGGREAREQRGLSRGDVVTLPELGQAGHILDVRLERSARAIGERKAAKIKSGLRLQCHHGSSAVPVRVTLLDASELRPGQTVLARLVLEKPIYAFVGDRMILRDWPEQKTLAGALVVDTDPDARRGRFEAQLELLRQRAAHPDDISVHLLSQLKRDLAAVTTGLLRQSRFSARAVQETARELAARSALIQRGDLAIDASWRSQILQAFATQIDDCHRSHPERPGMLLADLRSHFESRLPLPESKLFEVLVQELVSAGFALQGRFIRRAGHRPALPAQLQPAGQKLLARFQEKPFEPPSRKELAPDALAQQALRFFIETGQAIELGPELVLLSDDFQRATNVIRQVLLAQKSATVSELRQALKTSRRVMLPLLEYLDRSGVTCREEDRRRLV